MPSTLPARAQYGAIAHRLVIATNKLCALRDDLAHHVAGTLPPDSPARELLALDVTTLDDLAARLHTLLSDLVTLNRNL